MSQKNDIDSAIIAEQLRQQRAPSSGDRLGSSMNSFVVSGGRGSKDKEWILTKVQVIVQYRWMILGIALLIIGLTGLKVRVGDETYQATATLNIGIFNPVFQGERESGLIEETREFNYINTQLQLLKSLPLADRALASPEIRRALREELNLDLSLDGSNQAFDDQNGTASTALAGDHRYQNSPRALKRYLSILSVSLVRKTSLIEITATTHSPELSALIANTHAEKFIQHVRSERQKATIENLSLLKD
jgi:succinoglycan biosynthesis transport protein ExoP